MVIRSTALVLLSSLFILSSSPALALDGADAIQALAAINSELASKSEEFNVAVEQRIAMVAPYEKNLEDVMSAADYESVSTLSLQEQQQFSVLAKSNQRLIRFLKTQTNLQQPSES